MKLRKDDQVVVILGRDKGKTGKITRVMPADNMVVVENINIIKRHTKPSNKQPRGGILEITKPIHVSKVMVIDPGSGRPARISYDIKQDGSKERIFKVSRNAEAPKKKAVAAKVTGKPGKDIKDKEPKASKTASGDKK
jgi:large subunit ribosomal protein L24